MRVKVTLLLMLALSWAAPAWAQFVSSRTVTAQFTTAASITPPGNFAVQASCMGGGWARTDISWTSVKAHGYTLRRHSADGTVLKTWTVTPGTATSSAGLQVPTKTDLYWSISAYIGTWQSPLVTSATIRTPHPCRP